MRAEQDKPLITITLDQIDSVPVVVYRGEAVTRLVDVHLHYITDDKDVKPTYINIEHYEISKYPNTINIVHNKDMEHYDDVCHCPYECVCECND
jgi:hypothetical protein